MSVVTKGRQPGGCSTVARNACNDGKLAEFEVQAGQVSAGPCPNHRLGSGAVMQNAPAVAVVATFGLVPANAEAAQRFPLPIRRCAVSWPVQCAVGRWRGTPTGLAADRRIGRGRTLRRLPKAHRTRPRSRWRAAPSIGRAASAMNSGPITLRSRDISTRIVTTSRSLSSSSMARWSALRPSGWRLSSTRMSACLPVSVVRRSPSSSVTSHCGTVGAKHRQARHSDGGIGASRFGKPQQRKMILDRDDRRADQCQGLRRGHLVSAGQVYRADQRSGYGVVHGNRSATPRLDDAGIVLRAPDLHLSVERQRGTGRVGPCATFAPVGAGDEVHRLGLLARCGITFDPKQGAVGRGDGYHHARRPRILDEQATDHRKR